MRTRTKCDQKYPCKRCQDSNVGMLTPSMSFKSPPLSSVLILPELACIYMQQSVRTEQENDLVKQLERRLGQAESLFFSQTYAHLKYKRTKRESWTIRALQAEVERTEGVLRTTRGLIDPSLEPAALHRIPSAPSENTQLPSAVNVSKASERPSTLPGMVVQSPKLFVNYTISQDCTGSNDANSGSLLRALGQRPKKLQLKSRDTGGGIGKRFLHAGSLAESGLLPLQEAPPRHMGQQRCHSCNRTETPEWRRGPDGARTLCNECGLYYAEMTRKSRPKASLTGSNLRLKNMGPGSPSPDPTTLHTNSISMTTTSVPGILDGQSHPTYSTEQSLRQSDDLYKSVSGRETWSEPLKPDSPAFDSASQISESDWPNFPDVIDMHGLASPPKATEHRTIAKKDMSRDRLPTLTTLPPKTAYPTLRKLSKSGHNFQIGRQEPSKHDLSRLARSTKPPTFPKSMTARETRIFRMP